MQNKIKLLHEQIQQGNFSALARGITLLENELPGYELLLYSLCNTDTTKVIGITGPPGAGKSTLVSSLLNYWLQENKKIAVIAVDPSSPFNYGALLGDRIRMNEYYTNPNIYIRSLASRGALGGLSAKIIEITDLAKEAKFDYVVVETVGVGQSEVEIAGLADCTIVTLVPEAGDEVQTLKSGIMEIADIFVVNKADRSDAQSLYHNLRMMTHEKANGMQETPVLKTVATQKDGVAELANAINIYLDTHKDMPEKRIHLLVEKSWQLIQAERMKNINKRSLIREMDVAIKYKDFNLYLFTKQFMQQSK